MRRQNISIIVAYGTFNIDQALARAEERAAQGRPTVVVGIVRNPNTNCWWVCLARQRADLRWVSAHRLRKQADAQIALVERAAQGGRLVDDAVFAGLVHELAAHGDEDLQHTLALTQGLSVKPGQDQALTDLLRAVKEQELATREQLRKTLARQRRAPAQELSTARSEVG